MEYTFEFNGNDYTLPKYTIDIAEKLEKADAANRSNLDFKNKCKTMLKTCNELLGESGVRDAIGTLNDCDPNMLNILYLKICQCYNKPLESFNSDAIEDVLNTSQITQLMDMAKLAEKAKMVK